MTTAAVTDTHWMQIAIQEARKGIGLTSPNPPVGAAIVKDNQLLGNGWHQRAGQPHAEREAIAAATNQHGKDALRGATIYVTLEPCSTTGRTPACTDGIIEAGITRVVYGATDPNPAHAGRADQVLTEKQITVSRLTDKSAAAACDALIRPFRKVQSTGLPWVILKSAMSLDGRITRPPGEGQWLTSTESRTVVQKIRHSADAIITGGQTLRIDDPALTIRDLGLPEKPQPWRMIITRGERATLPASAQVFTDSHADRTLVTEHGDIHSALTQLVERGSNTVLVEAGGTLMTEFLRLGLADELALFYAPLLTGGPHRAIAPLPQDIPLTDPHYQRIGNDILLTALIQK